MIEVDMPCLISAQKGLNDPRYPSMRRILQAKKIKIEEITPAQLGLSAESLKPLLQIEEHVLPPPREPGRILEGSYDAAVSELLRVLTEEQKLL
jgi:electron transfer flavoprotein beta subunit